MAGFAHRRAQETISHDGPGISLFRADTARLEAFYAAAAKMVKAEVLSVGPDDYSPQAAANALAEVRAIVKNLDDSVSRWLESSVARHYDKAAAVARASLEILGKKPRRKAYVEHRRSLIEDTSDLLRQANGSIVDTAAKILTLTALAAREVAAQKTLVQEFEFDRARKRVSALGSKAVAEGESAGTLASKVRKYLTRLVGNGQFVNVNGRQYDMRTYAKMVGRTTLSEAQAAATLDLCHQYENDLVQWSDHGTVCMDCHEYEGNIYSISGNHPKYPPLTESPPLHPNCEHSLLPTSDITLEVEKRWGMYQTPGRLIGG